MLHIFSKFYIRETTFCSFCLCFSSYLCTKQRQSSLKHIFMKRIWRTMTSGTELRLNKSQCTGTVLPWTLKWKKKDCCSVFNQTCTNVFICFCCYSILTDFMRPKISLSVFRSVLILIDYHLAVLFFCSILFVCFAISHIQTQIWCLNVCRHRERWMRLKLFYTVGFSVSVAAF